MSTRAARFEIVRSAAGWHARYRAANGRIVWTTEVYTRRRAALEAIESIVDAPITSSPFSDGPEISRHRAPLEVRDIDERTEPVELTLEPPFYSYVYSSDETSWHDSEYHFRQCYDADCVEGTPPVGTEVGGWFGRVTFTGVTR